MTNRLAQNFLSAWRRPRWRWALVIALVSDAIGFGVVLIPLVQWLVDAVTAVVLLFVLGFRWPLMMALAVEVVPALELFPTWTLAVLAMSATTTPRDPTPLDREKNPPPRPSLPPGQIKDTAGKIRASPSRWARWGILFLATVGLGRMACAQPVLPPEAIDQFQHVIGTRVETVTILGGDFGAASGFYTFKGGNVADLDITKFGGGGEVAAVRPLGTSGLEWAPVLQGNLGFITARNGFTDGYLQGNESIYDVFAVQAGGGARIYFTEKLSVAAAISGIYGQTENEFRPQNAVGEAVKVAASGTYVDWRLETWSAVPSLDLRYTGQWQDTLVEFSSRYTFFHTESFASTSPVVNVSGDSHTWENKLDLDVPLSWEVFGRRLRTGGFVSRTDLGGSAAAGLNENHYYTVNGRLVVDLLGRMWKVRWLGVGASWFVGEHFNGWTAGLDVRFKF